MDPFAAYARGRVRRRRGHAHSVLRVALVLLLLMGLGLLAAPLASDAFARWQAQRVISSATAGFEALDDPARLEVKRQAQLYNRALAGEEVGERPLPYAEQLVYHGDPMISYLEVEKLAVRLPIYHGTEESALMAGVGHLETSSLPVGGLGSHCVLAGHSGMREARMFDSLEQLERGDRFTVWTLGEPYGYEVYATETVLPEEVQSLALKPGEDLCTLVTCTPYGVNSHRLLVHGRRCPYEERDVAQASDAEEGAAWALPAALAVAAALLALRAGMRIRQNIKAGSLCLEAGFPSARKPRFSRTQMPLPRVPGG